MVSEVDRRTIRRRDFLRLAGGALFAASLGGVRGQEVAPRQVRIGFVIPSEETGATSGRLVNHHRVAASAMRGAVFADESFFGTLAARGAQLHTRIAAVPDSRAAARAAVRMIAAERVDVLIGGFGLDVADAIADVSASRDVPFLNVGASEGVLRQRYLGAPVWHVALDDDQYVDAIYSWHLVPDSRIVVVGLDGLDNAPRVEAVVSRLHSRGASVADVIRIDGVEPQYALAARAVAQSEVDSALLVLGWHGQLDMLAQGDAHGYRGLMVGLPDAVTQTRDWIASTVRVAPGQASGPRFSAMEPSTVDRGLRALGDRFGARWRDPMDGAAWSLYQAVAIIAAAVGNADTARVDGDLKQLLSMSARAGHLVDADRAGIAYWRDANQLAHGVHVARANVAARGGHTYADKIAFAEYLGRVTSEGAVYRT